jgi:hypothetical protein
MVATMPLFISGCDTFPMMEAHMFGNLFQDSTAVPSFLCLMMAAAYFWQANRARPSYARRFARRRP